MAELQKGRMAELIRMAGMEEMIRTYYLRYTAGDDDTDNNV